MIMRIFLFAAWHLAASWVGVVAKKKNAYQEDVYADIVRMLEQDRDEKGYTEFSDVELFRKAVAQEAPRPYKMFLFFDAEEKYCETCVERRDMFEKIARSYAARKYNDVFFGVANPITMPKLQRIVAWHGSLGIIAAVKEDNDGTYSKDVPEYESSGRKIFEQRNLYANTKPITTRLLIDWVNAITKHHDTKIILSYYEIIFSMVMSAISLAVGMQLFYHVISFVIKRPILMASGALGIQFLAYSGICYHIINRRWDMYGLSQRGVPSMVAQGMRHQYVLEGIGMSAVIMMFALMWIQVSHMAQPFTLRTPLSIDEIDEGTQKKVYRPGRKANLIPSIKDRNTIRAASAKQSVIVVLLICFGLYCGSCLQTVSAFKMQYLQAAGFWPKETAMRGSYRNDQGISF